MMRFAVALSLTLFASACAVDMSTDEQDLDNKSGNGGGEPIDAKVVHVRGAAKPGGGGSPNLIYHGGTVMTSGAAVTPIFWGTSWANYSGDKITGLTSFYGGMGGTTYDGTNHEYTDGTGNVGSGVTVNTAIVDTSAAARSGSRTSVILNEVCAQIPANKLVANGYYPVYTDSPRGHAGYCAWHSTGTCNGVQIQFAFFFNLDGDSGCDPNSPVTGQSQGLQALANVSGHELSETLTDNHLDAWYDSSGAENSDKCAWTFGSSPVSFKNGTKWRIQGNWSNAAYNANSGYVDVKAGTVTRGCIDGTN